MVSSTVLSSWRDGWRRVIAAPTVAVGMFVLTFVLAVPLAIAVRGTIASHLGGSLVANNVADGADINWWQEFTAQATGLGTTFSPTILGFAATLDNVSSVLDGQGKIAPIASALALYLAGWAFLTGGIIDRFARQRPTRTHGFFAAAGVHFFRFLRLAVVAGLVYWWLFAYVHPWLFDEQYVTVTRGLSVERTAFLGRVVFYAIFGSILVFVNVVFDYAKVRIVVEDRHSVLGALLAALRFVRHHPRPVMGLYGCNGVTFMVVLALWALIAPDVVGSGFWMWASFVVGQIYILARLLVKLQFLASQTALFQANLAHATYAAAPVAVWPESPAAEAIGPQVRF